MMSDPEFIEEEAVPLTRIADDGNIVASENFDTVAWSEQFSAAMKLGFDTNEWSIAALLITQLWRELQDARVPAVDYVQLEGYIQDKAVDSSIRKYLALTLVEKSLAVRDLSTALADLARYLQSNPDYSAELLANTGIIKLQFNNDLAAAEEVLAQLRILSTQGDAKALQQVEALTVLIENHRRHMGSEPDQLPLPNLSPGQDENRPLLGNYPNPFNPETMIRYRVVGEDAQEVSLIIFNTIGQQVRKLISTRQTPGEYSVVWDGRDNLGTHAAGGMYFLRATIGVNTFVRKLMLVR